jgi:YHS domain-containing protein
VPCPDVFVQDVPEYVRRKELELACYFDPRRAAVIDAEHCARLNWEAYFFADRWEKERFLADPTLYCGFLTDPVSRQRFRPGPDAPSFEFKDVRYFFECAGNRTAFAADPEMYRLPHWSM